MADITVTFLDDATGQVLGKTNLSSDALPLSFDQPTTLHLGDDDWSVISIQPETRTEYVASRKLILRLRRVEKVDPGSILYSLPTLCDYIPPVGEQPLAGDELALAEDDWRQIELISHEVYDVADIEIEKIRQIHETQAAPGGGWRALHVRKYPEPPLECLLPLETLAEALGVSLPLAGVTYHGAVTRIVDGYSLTTEDGLSVYGVAPGGAVRVLGIASPPGPDSLKRLKALARRLDLVLVNWCRCAWFGPDDPLLITLLKTP
jgi:hypothetical protein